MTTIDKYAVLNKCEEIWQNADETTEAGVAIINAIDKLTDFIDTLPVYQQIQ